MEQLTLWTTALDNFMSGPWLIILLLGTGILLTFRTGFIQVRKIGMAIRLVLKGAIGQDKGEKEQGDISPFQALTTALAATVGNGNIAGVATAIFIGGPGGLFWMWMTAIFGMATKYAEAVLAVKFRKVAKDGSMAGGPMYYIEYGFKNKRFGRLLGIFFAVAGSLACLLGTGNPMQSNSIALVFNAQFGVPFWLTGLVVAFLVGIVIIGGIKRIGAVAERLVPAMILLYIGGAIFIILANITAIPAAFALIFRGAFAPTAAAGGFLGAMVRDSIQAGVSRGLLSNESGLGSAPIAHAAARTNDPVRQGTIAMSGVLIDTIIVCTMTGLVIILTGQWSSGLTSTELTASAFSSTIPGGGLIVAFSSALFGFSTLIGWSYYGEQCVEYLFGLKSTVPYRWVFVIVVFLGAIVKLDVVWKIGTSANSFMALPNLIGLIVLSGVVAKTTKEYFS